MTRDKDLHQMILDRWGRQASREGRLHGPWRLVGRPELVQGFEVTLGVHAGPESGVLEDAELPIAAQAYQRLPLEDAAFIAGKIGQEITAEEEVAAVDPVVGEVGLLAEFLNPVALD